MLIINILMDFNQLIANSHMHNLYAIIAKFRDICKQFAGNLVNEQGNIPRCGVVPRFSDLEVIALSMASESIGIDSESLLFVKLREYQSEIPHLISRRQYNDRRKFTAFLCVAFREKNGRNY